MQQLRDTFVFRILRRFPQLDLAEIYKILKQFKLPFLALAEQMDGHD